MAAFQARLPGLFHFLLLVAASTAVLALPTADEESKDATKVVAKANGQKFPVDYRYKRCMPYINDEFTPETTADCVITVWALPAVSMAEYLDCMSSPKKVLRVFSARQVLECALPNQEVQCIMPNFKKVTDALDYLLYAGVALNDTYNEATKAPAAPGAPINSRTSWEATPIGICQANKVEAAYKLKKGYRNLMPFDEVRMAKDIKKRGPIIATMYIDVSKLEDGETYEEGIFNSDSLCSTSVAGYSFNAALTDVTKGAAYPVMVVGYGTVDGLPVWILRNDWLGQTWGVGGYFYLKRGINACGIALNPIRVLG